MKDRIKELRKSLDLTQQKFADRLGLKRQTIAAYEMGNIEPSESTLLLICREFGVNKEWLTDGVEPMRPPDKLSTYLGQIKKGNDEFIKELIEVYMELDPDSKKALRVIADKMNEKRKERGQ